MLRRQKILIAPATTYTDTLHETKIQYEEPVECFASIYPEGDGISAQIYGLRPDEMRLLILPRYAEIKEMDGVWLPEDDPGMPPPWEVTGAPKYARHITAVLKRRVNFGGQ